MYTNTKIYKVTHIFKHVDELPNNIVQCNKSRCFKLMTNNLQSLQGIFLINLNNDTIIYNIRSLIQIEWTPKIPGSFRPEPTSESKFSVFSSHKEAGTRQNLLRYHLQDWSANWSHPLQYLDQRFVWRPNRLYLAIKHLPITTSRCPLLHHPMEELVKE